MGYWTQDGRFANTQDVTLFDGTASENGSSEAVELADRGTVRLSLDVTEAMAGGGDNEIQKIEFTGIKEDEGTFRVSADGGETFSEPIEVGPTMATDLQAALDDLLGAGNASVSASNEPGETALLVEFTGDLAGKDVPLLVVDDSELVPSAGVSAVYSYTIPPGTDGTYELTYGSEPPVTVSAIAAAEDVQSSLEEMPSIGEGNVTVSLDPFGTYTITFGGALAEQPVDSLSIDAANLIGSPGTNAILQYDLGDASGGTYVIEHVSTEEATSPLAYDADAQTIQSAIEGLSAIGEGNVSVSKDGTLVTIEFVGDLAGSAAPAGTVFSIDAESLEGDGSPYVISVIRVQDGSDAAQPQANVTVEQEGQPAGTPDVAMTVTQEPAPGPWALDVEVETSHDGQSWQSLGQFTQASDLGSERKVLVGCDRFVRASYELTGTAPEVTFRVSGEAV